MAITDKLTAIADAIRNKTGDSSLLTLDEMPAAIESISGGGGGASGHTITFKNVIATTATVYFYLTDGTILIQYGRALRNLVVDDVVAFYTAGTTLSGEGRCITLTIGTMIELDIGNADYDSIIVPVENITLVGAGGK